MTSPDFELPSPEFFFNNDAERLIRRVKGIMLDSLDRLTQLHTYDVEVALGMLEQETLVEAKPVEHLPNPTEVPDTIIMKSFMSYLRNIHLQSGFALSGVINYCLNEYGLQHEFDAYLSTKSSD